MLSVALTCNFEFFYCIILSTIKNKYNNISFILYVFFIDFLFSFHCKI